MSTRRSYSGIRVATDVTADRALSAGTQVTSKGLYDTGVRAYSDVAGEQSMVMTQSPTPPPAPASGQVVWWAENSGRMFTKNSEDVIRPLTSLDSVLNSASGQVSKVPASTTLQADGLTGTTIVGNAVDADDDIGRWLALSNTGGSTTDRNKNFTTLYTPSFLTRRQWGSELVMGLRAGPSVATCRLWAGWANTLVDYSPTPAAHIAAFRYDTSRDTGGFIRTVTAAGTATQQVKVTTVPYVADRQYRLRVSMREAAVDFYIDDVMVSTHTTNLPTGYLGYVISLTSLTTAVRTIRFQRLAVVFYA